MSEGKFDVLAIELIEGSSSKSAAELEDQLRKMSKRDMQYLQNVLKTTLSSSITLRKKLVADVSHAQAETIALRNQVGASAEFYTKALVAAEQRSKMLQVDCDQCEEKLEDVKYAYDTLGQLREDEASSEKVLQQELATLKEALYEHTRHFCEKELPILQAVSWQQAQHEESPNTS